MTDVYGDGQDSWKTIGMILGEDVHDGVVMGPTKNIVGEMRAAWTVFGLMLLGCTKVEGLDQPLVQFCMLETPNGIERIWELDHIGITDQNKSDFEVAEIVSKLSRKKIFSSTTLEM